MENEIDCDNCKNKIIERNKVEIITVNGIWIFCDFKCANEWINKWLKKRNNHINKLIKGLFEI